MEERKYKCDFINFSIFFAFLTTYLKISQALLLLTQLTKSNTNLQKIVAFENGYDHIFEIIRSEGFADGGVVVEDCLILMLNLLRNNPSNQTFFKEGSCAK